MILSTTLFGVIFIGVLTTADHEQVCNVQNDGTYATGVPSNHTPVTEVPPMTFGNLTCDPFNTSIRICAKWLSGLSVVTNHSRSGQNAAATDLGNIFQSLSKLQPSNQCLSRALPLLCRYAFPTCDPAFSKPVYQPLCKWDCEIVRDIFCPAEWQIMLSANDLISFGVIDRFNCTKLSQANAGNAPMCISTQDGAPVPRSIQTCDCYNGKGQGYLGTVNVTESGIECQSWSVQYPHQYLLSHDQAQQYPELEGGHNFCRNPGGRGSKPWCFTTNKTMRWENCGVPSCSPGPTCQRYTGALCRHVGTIAMDYVYINTSIANQDVYEFYLRSELRYLDQFPRCRKAMTDLLCRMNFPLCDYSSHTPKPRPLCRRYCNEIYTQCADYIPDRNRFQSVRPPDNPVKLLENCTTDSVPANGGDNPECDQLIPVSQRGFIVGATTDCYNISTKGVDYVGNISVTVDGIACQPWDAPSLIPDPTAHIHPISSLFRQYLENHNHCRNPEGRGDRPWCYTQSKNIRWQYCDITACKSFLDNITANNSSPMNSSNENLHNVVILALAVPVAGITIIVLLLIFFTCSVFFIQHVRRQRSKAAMISSSNGLVQLKELKTTSQVNPLYTKNPKLGSMEFNALEYEASKLIRYPKDCLTYICDLGEGHFGVVIKAEASGISVEGNLTVAVKVLKEGSSIKMKEEFFREATFVNNFDHPNIVKLIGVCSEQEPYCMILEYMSEGDLNGLLRHNNPTQSLISAQRGATGFSIKQLVDMAIDIAAGLSYLSKYHYVHRDLATRNCLVNKDLKVKLADFGLSQEIYTDNYFRLKGTEMLPIRWMPPESIVYAKFSAQGDVWSFGVVLWEIFSFGAQPYFGKSNEEVVQYVRDGNVLEPPLNCPQEIYDLMVDCWAMDPNERPTSEELHVGLQRWTPEMSASLHVQAKQVHYQNMTTILEYARKSLDGTAQVMQIENRLNGELAKNTNECTCSLSVKSSYDTLQPMPTDVPHYDENLSVLPLPAIIDD